MYFLLVLLLVDTNQTRWLFFNIYVKFFVSPSSSSLFFIIYRTYIYMFIIYACFCLCVCMCLCVLRGNCDFVCGNCGAGDIKMCVTTISLSLLLIIIFLCLIHFCCSYLNSLTNKTHLIYS